MELAFLGIVLVVVPFFVIVIGGPYVIVCRILRRRRRGRCPDMPEPPADQRALHKASLGSLGSVLFLGVFVASLRLYVLAYMDMNDTDGVEGYRLFLPAMFASPCLLLCAISWIKGLEGIIELQRRRTALRRCVRAFISYLLEVIAPAYLLPPIVPLLFL